MKLKGSMTVEMSLLMPLVLLLIMGCVLSVFYYHDKNVIAGVAYETAVVGSTKAREKDGIKQGELEQLWKERVGRKCILFATSSAEIGVSKEEVTVEAYAKKGSMALSVVKRARITEPEKLIRDMRRIGKK